MNAINVALLALLAGMVSACSRHADVRDDSDAGGSFDNGLPLPPADIPTVDGGIEPDAIAACAKEEYTPDCVGPVDFTCQPFLTVQGIASTCLYTSGCHANGWLRVTFGTNGCIASVGMDQPDDAILACVVPWLERVHCPCTGQHVDVFLGVGHEGDAGVPCVPPKG